MQINWITTPISGEIDKFSILNVLFILWYSSYKYYGIVFLLLLRETDGLLCYFVVSFRCFSNFFDDCWITYGLWQCDPYFDDIGCSHPGCEPAYPTPKCVRKCQVKNQLWAESKHFSVDAYRIESDPYNIMAEVYKNGPVEVAFTVYEVTKRILLRLLFIHFAWMCPTLFHLNKLYAYFPDPVGQLGNCPSPLGLLTYWATG